MPRNFSRTPVSFDVLCDLPSGPLEARVSDISVSGCFVEAAAGARTGEIVSMRIRIDEQEWLALRGVVAFNREREGFGLQFIELGAGDIGRLERAILKHSGNPWDRDGAGHYRV